MDYTKIPIDRRNLERIIVTHPRKSTITKEWLLERNETLIDKGLFSKIPAAVKDGRTVDEIDINQIRLNQTNFNPMLKKIGWGWMAISLLIMVFLNRGFDVVVFWAGIIPSLISLILGHILPKDKQIVFHRHNGILELHGAFFDKPHHIPFNDVPAFFAPNGTAGLFHWTLKVKRSFKPFQIKDFFPIDIDIFLEGGWQAWSYWVWYMDRNRPLPPGDALDEFREADFQRRKSEGFPPPLYKSRIPTPEATTEQQIERERYWRDEEYLGKHSVCHVL